MKNKILFIGLIFGCLLLTGCGGKECAKWETYDGTKSDCYGTSGADYYKCIKDNVGKDGKITQECVEWK